MKIPSFTRKELSSLFFSLTEKNIIYDGINFLNSFLFSFLFRLSSFLFFFLCLDNFATMRDTKERLLFRRRPIEW